MLLLSAHFGTVPGDTQTKQREKGDLSNLKPSVGSTKEGPQRDGEGPGRDAWESA